ncbi:hypothetical protein RHS01_10717 [Rhizoctonia solani]|uniref:Uncharacterized protein n=1 Tax=Rhizoctonia solani TaxID=456999 RepID=A0A8H7LZP2_9AGAM|nr:hypothetical protein RHS01_10717 [Rhizoctonia solani]
MGYITDGELEFEEEQDPAIAKKVASINSDPDNTVARDYAALCCEEFGLTDLDKADVLRVSQMHAQFIAFLLTESFLLSTKFKDHVTRRIQATFLDATIPTYVRGSTARLIQHMQENPGSWRIPRAVHAHFVNSKAFRKQLRQLRAIFVAICGGRSRSYQPTNEHWRHFALLRSYMADWEKLRATLEGGAEHLTGHSSTQSLTSSESAAQSPQSPLRKPRSKDSEWQRDHGKAVADMLEYTVEAYPDEDDDDEDAPTVANPRRPIVVAPVMAPAQEDNREAPQTNAGGDNVEPQVNNGRAPRVLVPETQESQSMGGTQQGWTGGALVDRYQRPTHTTSPISRPNAASTFQHRPN